MGSSTSMSRLTCNGSVLSGLINSKAFLVTFKDEHNFKISKMNIILKLCSVCTEEKMCLLENQTCDGSNYIFRDKIAKIIQFIILSPKTELLNKLFLRFCHGKYNLNNHKFSASTTTRYYINFGRLGPPLNMQKLWFHLTR